MTSETKLHRKSKSINPYLTVLLSFVMVILVGAALINMPWARTSGDWGSFVDALFVATSATCVTGLCTYADGIGNVLNIGGQAVVLVLIIVGGLGFITLLTFFVTLFKNKLQFKSRYTIAQMVNSTNIADVVKFVRRLIVICAISVFIGFGFGIPVFLQLYPDDIFKALWTSFFTAASAFNNAGFDTLGSTSLIRDAADSSIILNNLSDGMYIYLNVYLMLLIILGGISFLVILDVFSFKRKPRQWKVFTKIVLLTTSILLLVGSIVFVSTECFKSTNAMTPLQAIFQSVTCRTAGFATYNQDNLSMAGKVVSCVLMFIGGSPLSTAGGIKTTTIFMIVLAIGSYLTGKTEVVAFKRKYSPTMIVKAMSLLFLGIIAVVVGYILLSVFERDNVQATSDNMIFELFSSFGTTGLSCNLTPTLHMGSKFTLIVIMFIGRLGPFTFFQLFQSNLGGQSTRHFDYIEEDFLIG